MDRRFNKQEKHANNKVEIVVLSLHHFVARALEAIVEVWATIRIMPAKSKKTVSCTYECCNANIVVT